MLRVSFKTLGCRLNQAETAQLAALFRAAGYETAAQGQAADVSVIHTCTVTRTAERECLRLARSARQANPETLVVLAGCAVEAADPDALASAGADLLVGQQDKWRLPELVRAKMAGSPLPSEPAPPSKEPPVPSFQTTRALVKVQDGCSFRCAYCIVPDARGEPRSRPAAEIVREAEALAAQGYREIVLTGANLGCYADGNGGLVALLRSLDRVSGIERIRLSSVEISTVEREVVDCLLESPKLCRYLHLPLQSGDDGVLARMRRRYRADDYRRLVDYALKRLPLLGLGTDVLVGFPGEDERAFNRTLDLVRELPFSNLHVFPYSSRPGTPAAAMPDPVPSPERKERARAVIRLGQAKRIQFAADFVGRGVSVLIESSDGKTGSGWTSEYLEARLPAGPEMVNRIAGFRPTRSDGATLWA